MEIVKRPANSPGRTGTVIRLPKLLPRRAALVMLAGVLAAAGPVRAEESPGEAAPEAALVQVDAVTNGPLSQTAPVLGRLVSRRSGIVAARSGGPVARILVEVGDRVAEGDVLAELVTDRLQARYDQVRAELVLAEQELARIAELRASGSAAFARSRFDQAVQEKVSAESRLRLTEIDLADASILAPFGGVVSVRHTEAGAWLTAGDDVVTLVDDRNMEIEADVPATLTPGLEPGLAVIVEFTDGAQHEAVVRAVIPEENPRSRTRAVRFTPDFNGGAGRLAANQSVTVHVPVSGSRDALSVHKDAVIHRGGNNLVFVVGPEGIAEIRPVTLGVEVGDRFEVLGGLVEGDLVVIRGNERLQPGQAVRWDPAGQG